ncbi:sigma-70 family RNA polymerase sigma factor [Sphingobacterium sp. lm-10]|uniref:RNA polymerase sigma factor n=1 Tax=Sphingobacterium sp. lm-10 TaxID=2944904 RepID=UPI002021142C|nr:sigma-70 family RNA polymerase sigma factor [Sphingobacterium sp. lm-10]MCL7987289.1 sigma-70 family RNA polymerase sigma factor [Sphingobacterium sp. lm-10]MCL8000500.1 sigma-70 family RNA polymerase sigma factor [Brucella sp. 21LCYQ03]
MDKFDKQIVDLQQGKETSLCFFMDEYAAALQFFAFKMIGHKEASAEIVSDSFVKLWDRRTHFHEAYSIKSFLYLITRNACLDHLKESRNKYAHEETFLEDLVASDSDILKKIIYNELIELIVLEIKKLPKQQAKVFQLAMMEGRNTQEICDELQTSASTVYFARSKAIAALKKVFEQKNLSMHYIFLLPIVAAEGFFIG